MEISGKIKVIFDKQTFNSGFEKREFVVTTQEQYPQDIKLELYNDKCTLIDSHQVNDEVNVQFNLRGNEYQGKYFVNLNAWKIEKSGGAEGINEQGVGEMASAPLPSEESPFDTAADEDSDLPF